MRWMGHDDGKPNPRIGNDSVGDTATCAPLFTVHPLVITEHSVPPGGGGGGASEILVGV